MKRNVSLVGAQRHCAPTFFLRRRVSQRRNAPWVYERLRPSRRMRARGPRAQEPGGEWRPLCLIVPHTREHIRSGPRYGQAPHARNPAVQTAAPHTNGMNILLGRAAPSQTLPQAEGWGNPVSPSPCLRARPSRGQGRGETRFPHTPAPAAYVHVRHGFSRAMRYATVSCRTAPSLTLPPGRGKRAPPPSGGWLGGGQNAANGTTPTSNGYSLVSRHFYNSDRQAKN